MESLYFGVYNILMGFVYTNSVIITLKYCTNIVTELYNVQNSTSISDKCFDDCLMGFILNSNKIIYSEQK